MALRTVSQCGPSLPLRCTWEVARLASQTLPSSTSACSRECVRPKPSRSEPFPRAGGRRLLFSLLKRVLCENRSALFTVCSPSVHRFPQQLMELRSVCRRKTEAQSKETEAGATILATQYSVCVHALTSTRICPVSSTRACVHIYTPQ